MRATAPRLGAQLRRRVLRHLGPDEAEEFPGHGRHRDGRGFAMADEVAIASMQPLLRVPRVRDDRRRLIGTAASQGAPDGGGVAIVPGGFSFSVPIPKV